MYRLHDLINKMLFTDTQLIRPSTTIANFEHFWASAGEMHAVK